MKPPIRRTWQLVDTVGPLFSHSGLKNWDLCLAREAVIARPRSLWPTLEAGLWAGLGSPRAMQRVWANSASPTGERVLQDDGEAYGSSRAVVGATGDGGPRRTDGLIPELQHQFSPSSELSFVVRHRGWMATVRIVVLWEIGCIRT
jgi:hypothetical protein